MKITDECQKIGEETEKIFNTVLELIFDQEANDPYLKSDEKVGMYFSKPVKVSQLLKKVKKMNAISTHYKLRGDISNQNKYRSLFKKLYLKKTEKTIHNPYVIECAFAYTSKFTKKHIEAVAENASFSKKKYQMIPPFEDLVDNNETDYSRYLQTSVSKQGTPIYPLSLSK